MVDQFGRVRISAEVFGSAMASRYLKNANVLAKFIQNNETTDLFPGQVQYYFEHTVRISGELKTHRLVFTKWYKLTPNQKTWFYTSIDGNEKSSSIELWQNDFCDIERDCLIPIHYLYSQFVSSKFVIGKKNPITYNAVIPINRQFHLWEFLFASVIDFSFTLNWFWQNMPISGLPNEFISWLFNKVPNEFLSGLLNRDR